MRAPFMDGIRIQRWSCCLAALLMASVAPVQAQFADSITVRPLAEGLYLLQGAQDLIVASVGEDGTLLVDAGYGETEGLVRDALASVGAREPSVLVNTHWHHTFANAAFGSEALVVAHQTVLRRSRRANRMFGQLVPAVPPAGRPDVVFQDSLTLRFNGEHIRLVHLPLAHTDGDLAVFFPGANVVMTGDVAVAHMPWTDPDQLGRFDHMLKAVDRLLATIPADATIVPGHGEPFGYETLQAYGAMLHETRDTVLARIVRGESLAEVQAGGPPPAWSDWEGGVPASLFLASVYRAYGPDDGETPPPIHHFANGRWWNGDTFEEGDWYSVGGRFTRHRPARVDSVIELGGRWVIPPLADAHTHRFGSQAHLAEDHEDFRRAGVFYGMVQDPAHEVSAEMRRRSDRVENPDLTYTQGVITPSWGVIADFYDMMAARGMYGEGVERADLEDRLLFLIDDAVDLEARWPGIEALNDDFVKVILAFSEEHEVRRADPETYGAEPPAYSRKPGLDPTLLAPLVEKAHAAGLRVSAHIETAADFRLAVDAGVDVVAHMPASWQAGATTGFPDGDLSPWLLTESDAARAAAARVVVVTTASPPPDKVGQPHFDRIHRHNLRLLRRHGATVALGSDQFEGTVVDEIQYLEGLDVYTPGELLRIAVETTPGVLFPLRRLGRIAEGYEASFLVLGGDPTTGLDALGNLEKTVKQGHVLSALGDTQPQRDLRDLREQRDGRVDPGAASGGGPVHALDRRAPPAVPGLPFRRLSSGTPRRPASASASDRASASSFDSKTSMGVGHPARISSTSHSSASFRSTSWASRTASTMSSSLPSPVSGPKASPRVQRTRRRTMSMVSSRP